MRCAALCCAAMRCILLCWQPGHPSGTGPCSPERVERAGGQATTKTRTIWPSEPFLPASYNPDPANIILHTYRHPFVHLAIRACAGRNLVRSRMCAAHKIIAACVGTVMSSCFASLFRTYIFYFISFYLPPPSHLRELWYRQHEYSVRPYPSRLGRHRRAGVPGFV